jgi:hypothetical protein
VPYASEPGLDYLWRGQYATKHPAEYVGTDDRIHIPAGFETDLASVPRIFWALLPPQGAYEKAAVLHDFLCVELARCHRDGGAAQVNAVDTDGMFRRVMREDDGVPNVVAWIMWAGVRWGALFNPARRAGWWHWRSAPPTVAITGTLLASLAWLVWELDGLAHSAPWT